MKMHVVALAASKSAAEQVMSSVSAVEVTLGVVRGKKTQLTARPMAVSGGDAEIYVIGYTNRIAEETAEQVRRTLAVSVAAEAAAYARLAAELGVAPAPDDEDLDDEDLDDEE